MKTIKVTKEFAVSDELYDLYQQLEKIDGGINSYGLRMMLSGPNDDKMVRDKHPDYAWMLREAISDWDATCEGYGFWENVYDKLDNLTKEND